VKFSPLNIESKKRIFFFILILNSIFYYYVLDKKIYNSLPYPRHIDERHRLKNAVDILKTGDFNPGYFHKPSLPIYLTSLGLTAGFFRAAVLGKVNNVEDIGSVSYPYFSQPIIVYTAKQIFALFSVLAIFFTGIIIYKAFGNENLIIIPSLIIPFSKIYWTKSFLYINVNILGTLFVAISLAYLFCNVSEKGVVKKSIVPGILCGLCLSSKFNLFPIYIPFFIAIVLYDRKNILAYIILLILTSILTVSLMNPYFLLDLPRFLNHTAYQIYHYTYKGHRGFEGAPGLPQIIYHLKSLINQFGLNAFIFSIVGIFFMFRFNWKTATILISFPMGLLIFMSAVKVNFLRNLTAVYLLWPIFITLGVFYFYKKISEFIISHLHFSKRDNIVRLISFYLALLILAFTLPFMSLRSNFEIAMDSRNEVTTWIQNNVDKNAVIVIPKDLRMDSRSLEKQYTVQVLERKKINFKYLHSQYIKKNHYILIPAYGFDSRGRKGRRKAGFFNAQFDALKNNLMLMQTFGSNKVLLNYSEPVPHGNPRFNLMKVIIN